MAIRDVYSAGLAWLFGQLRAAFDQADTTATVEARNSSRGGYTDTTPQFDVVVRAGIPVLVRPMRAEAVVRQNRDTSQVWVNLYFLGDPGVTREHRIAIGEEHYLPAGTIDFDKASGIYCVPCILVRG